MTIKTDLGTIAIAIDTKNLKLQMFFDSLKDKIEIYGLDEIINLIDGIPSVNELKEKISELEGEIVEKDNEINDFEFSEDSIECNSEIQCGIGVINYEEPDNLLLQDLMENFEASIKKNNPKKVNELLSQSLN